MKPRKHLAVLIGIAAVMTGSLLAYAAEHPQEPAAVPAVVVQPAACPYYCPNYPDCEHRQECPNYPDCEQVDGCPYDCPRQEAPQRPAWSGHGRGGGRHGRR